MTSRQHQSWHSKQPGITGTLGLSPLFMLERDSYPSNAPFAEGSAEF